MRLADSSIILVDGKQYIPFDDYTDLAEQCRGLQEQNAAHLSRIEEQQAIMVSQAQQASTSLLATSNNLNDRLSAMIAWLQAVMRNKKLAAGMKIAIIALGLYLWNKRDEYTTMYDKQLADMTGFSRQTAGRARARLVSWGFFSEERTTIEVKMPDARGQESTVEMETIALQPAATLFSNSDIDEWARGDGKTWGGKKPKCEECHQEETLEHPFYRVCDSCGLQDLRLSQTAIDAILQRAMREAAIDSEARPSSQAHGFAMVKETVQDAITKAITKAIVTFYQPEQTSVPLQEVQPVQVEPTILEPTPEPEVSTRDYRARRLDAWGAVRGYPRARLSNGVHIPRGEEPWSNFPRYQEQFLQQAYEDVVNGTIQIDELA